MAERPTLLVVGAATRDIDAADPRGWRMGGGVSYAAMAAARLGVSVRALIGVDGATAQAHELETLAGAGVELRLVPLARGPIFDNRESPAGRVQHAAQASDPLPATALPEEWRSPTGAILAPVAGELGDDWAGALAADTFVALAGQGLARRLVPGEQIECIPFTRGALAERADAIALSGEDVAAGAPPIRELLALGQSLLVTHGDSGALHVSRAATGIAARYMPSLPRRAAVDTTGAGDTFLAAWMAARVLVGNGWRPLAVASAMASLSVQSRSLAEMPTARDLSAVLVMLRDRHPL